MKSLRLIYFVFCSDFGIAVPLDIFPLCDPHTNTSIYCWIMKYFSVLGRVLASKFSRVRHNDWMWIQLRFWSHRLTQKYLINFVKYSVCVWFPVQSRWFHIFGFWNRWLNANAFFEFWLYSCWPHHSMLLEKIVNLSINHLAHKLLIITPCSSMFSRKRMSPSNFQNQLCDSKCFTHFFVCMIAMKSIPTVYLMLY